MNYRTPEVTGTTRRSFLCGGTAALLSSGLKAQQGRRSGALYAYVGCYTTAQRHARGDGIHVYRVDPETGTWTHVQHVGNLVNPSFLAVDQQQRFLYSVHGDEEYATSFSIDRSTGQLTPLNRAATGGKNGVHLGFTSGGHFLVIANYTSGNVAVLPVKSDGSLGDASQVSTLSGKPGPLRTEQNSSHPHHIVFDRAKRFVIVPDKGLDRVFVFSVDGVHGKLTPTAQGSVEARPASGPRHAAFHPSLNVLWVLNELGSSITTYSWNNETGHLQPLQILPTLPSDFTGESAAAEIAAAPHGKYVYCSNRGHDSVAIFAADSAKGLLTFNGWVPSRGKTPRFIGFDPSYRFFYGTNEQSDTVVNWRFDPATGRLTATEQMIHNASPVTIAWVQA